MGRRGACSSRKTQALSLPPAPPGLAEKDDEEETESAGSNLEEVMHKSEECSKKLEGLEEKLDKMVGAAEELDTMA